VNSIEEKWPANTMLRLLLAMYNACCCMNTTICKLTVLETVFFSLVLLFNDSPLAEGGHSLAAQWCLE
jgi:hypothetical protein